MIRRDTLSPSRRGRIAGFSVFELVLVMIVVAIVAVYAIPRFTSASEVSLSATGARLAANLRHAQALAMSNGQRYRVALTATTFQITDAGGAPIVQPLTASTAAISVAPASLSGYNPPLTGGYVEFDTQGRPYVAPATPLAADAVITVTEGTSTMSVRLVPETGHVR